MKLQNIQKVTFAWASTVIGATGVSLLSANNYFLGISLILLALSLEVAREYLKKYFNIEK